MNDERGLPGKANIPILIMSFVLAMILWAVVYTQEATDTRTVLIRLETDGLDTQRYALVSRLPDNYPLNVRGPAERLKQITNGKETGLIDLRQARPGTHSYTIGLPADLRDLSIPDAFPKFDLTIEEVDHISKLPVRFGSSGKLADSNELMVHPYVFPHVVDVIGPKSALGRVSEARVTLDLSKVEPEKTRDYEGYVELYDEHGKQLNQTELGLSVRPPIAAVTPNFVSAPVQKTAFVFVVFKGQPSTGYAVDGYTCTPSTVTVTGTSLALAGLTQLQTEPVDLSGLSATHQFTVKLLKPPGVTASAPGQVKLRVAIRAMTKSPR